jgi:hydroxyacylglutathione hydrolase
MKMWKTKQKNEVFQILDGRTNCYFIPTDQGNILIDAGMRSVYPSLKKHIKSMHLVNDKVDFLVLTHTHFDHCQSAALVKSENSCRIIVGEKEAEFASKGYTPIPQGTYMVTRFLNSLGNMMIHGSFGYEPFNADILVGDCYNLLSGDIKIDLISTSGHSDGSISVIVDDDIALVGDTMIGIFTDSIFPPFADNVPAMIMSWQKLLKTDCRIFLPGHGHEISRKLLQKHYDKYALKYKVKKVV